MGVVCWEARGDDRRPHRACRPPAARLPLRCFFLVLTPPARPHCSECQMAELDNNPFYGLSPIRVAHEVAYNQLKLRLSERAAAACPPGFEALMQSCWQAEPTARPSFDALAMRLAPVDAG